MKRIDELGISPWPWWIGKLEDLFFYGSIVCNTKDGKKIVATSNYSFDCHKADDLIMSAAPDMYKTEYDLVDVIERLMNGWAGTCDTPTQDEVVAALEAAKNALAKAAGEEVSNA